MYRLLKRFLPPEKMMARNEKILQKAISSANQEKIENAFFNAFMFLWEEKDAPHLSNLILSYISSIDDCESLEIRISSIQLGKIIQFLEKSKFDSAALMLCDCFGYETEAVEILAKHGRANDLMVLATKGDTFDKDLFSTAIEVWEKYNGDIRKSPTMGSVLINVSKFAPESFPDNPRVREIVGQFEDAARLYVIEGNLRDAARCYEQAERYSDALGIYKEIGDNEKASQVAESMGDFEEALKMVVNPERKINLLIRTERFQEARRFAVGFEYPDKYFSLIKKRARQRMEVKVNAHDFIGAMELADIAECESAERERILLLGRQHFDRKIASATSDEDIESIYRDKVKLEEKAGHFEEAGKLAEEILGDLDLASRLYEKANLFNRAIGTTSTHSERLAELHKKGGNLLKAAQVYETIGQYDKAFKIYEDIRHYNKAIECYLKTNHPNDAVLIRLYSGAGEFETVIDIYMRAGTFADLEQALSIATTHRLTSHIRVLQEKISEFKIGNRGDLQKCFVDARNTVSDTYSKTIGIDFGTSNSVTAIFNLKTKKVEIICAMNGSEYVPSFWGVDDKNHPIFGETARIRSLTAPGCVVSRVKRSLGKRKIFSIGEKQYRSEQVVAMFLQHLKLNAELYIQLKVRNTFYDLLEQGNLRFPTDTLNEFLNEKKEYKYIKDVVLSVPAYFNDNQKRATRDAAEIAGLSVQRLLHEPSAAALAYGHQTSYSGKLAVIDLGGGTLDISIVDIGEGINDVQTVGGDTALGGSDIDAKLVEHVLKDIKSHGKIIDEDAHSVEITRLRDACENLKINLSSVQQSTMELPYFLNEPKYTFTLSRIELERLSQPVLDRIKTVVKETVKEHGSNIDNFILVGNATKMPAVVVLIKSIIPAKQLVGLDPGTVVATGAALQGAVLAGELKRILLLDIVPYSLGVAVFQPGMEKETISKLIEKNSPIPVTKSEVYSTKTDNQPNVYIKIYQGESPEPHKNYFLGDFIFGIPPAPANTPQIEVTFDIGADCILTVTAMDKATGGKQSIKIEGSVVLSSQEKEKMRNYFAQREKAYSFEKELEQIKIEIDALKLSCGEVIKTAERTIRDFFEQFHEKIEINPHLYKVSPEQVREIQDMFIRKNLFIHGIPQYHDQFASTLNNLKQLESRHLDYSDSNIVSKLNERMYGLIHYKQVLENIIISVKANVITTLENWLQILEEIEPDLGKMDSLELARYHLTEGRVNKVREILESQAVSEEGLTKESFHLLLKCYVSLGLKDEYRNTHKRFGNLFDMVYPDFSHLNSYLITVDDSVFMVQGVSERRVISVGSGFCIAPNLLVTNRHVVEKLTRQQIQIIGKDTLFKVDNMELDPTNDLAILHVKENLNPLKLGEFSFVEPGEQVLAIGFPSPNSSIHRENIYISKGIVNSIRKIDALSERVIFIDTKIRSGMSGGPLINELGEVIGIVSFVQYKVRPSEEGPMFVENQPVALPIDLVRKYAPNID